MTQPHLRRLDKDELVDKLLEENKRLKDAINEAMELMDEESAKEILMKAPKGE